MTTIVTPTSKPNAEPDVQPKGGDSKLHARSRLQRWRANNPRIDYAPSAKALTIILRLQSLNPNLPVGVLIDYMIVQTDKAISGNARNP